MTSNKEPDFYGVKKSNIWLFKQNKPSLVVKDIMQLFHQGHPDERNRHLIFSSLLARGVFKWLAVRRELIKLKLEWRGRITAIRTWGLPNKSPQYNKGYAQALEDCTRQVRKLCHSERWKAPDHDREANKWLKEQS